jgi:hypothetical protein
VDPITLLIATGLRESELLGLLWTDFDADAATLTVTGKVARPVGQGMQRYDTTKSEAGLRTLPLPRFAVEMLTARRDLPYFGEQTMIFPSTAGTIRDPNNFNTRWRRARDDLGVPGVTTQLPQIAGDPDRRRRAVGPHRRRPPGPHQRIHDARPLYEPRPNPSAGSRPAGSGLPVMAICEDCRS